MRTDHTTFVLTHHMPATFGLSQLQLQLLGRQLLHDAFVELFMTVCNIMCKTGVL